MGILSAVVKFLGSEVVLRIVVAAMEVLRPQVDNTVDDKIITDLKVVHSRAKLDKELDKYND